MNGEEKKMKEWMNVRVVFKGVIEQRVAFNWTNTLRSSKWKHNERER